MVRRRARKTVDLRPVLMVFVVSFLVLGFGFAIPGLPKLYVVGAFLAVLVIAFAVLARSIATR